MYAIWFIPKAEQNKELANLINELSNKHNAPRFSPHITLLSNLNGSENELANIMSQLAPKMNSFSVCIECIDTQDSYYRCLYLKIEKSRTILDYRKMSETMFNVTPTADFMPHLSLLYGNYSDTKKDLITHDLPNNITQDLLIDRIDLISADGLPNTWKTVVSEYLG